MTRAALPGADESRVRIAHPHARACAIYHPGQPASWYEVAVRPAKPGGPVIGTGPTEDAAWRDAAERMRAAAAYAAAHADA